jgi:N utilization substance protein B
MTESRSAARRQAVFLLYQRDVTGLSLAELTENAERERGEPLGDYTREVLGYLATEEERVDVAIDGAARGWSIDRIAPLERNILRVAVAELVGREDIPTAVAIDEAVDMAKRYCQADAAGFVNGILGTVARERQARA